MKNVFLAALISFSVAISAMAKFDSNNPDEPPASKSESSYAYQINEKLGRGINLGNCFEAPRNTSWGVTANPEFFPLMSEFGFSHVRIPVRWSDYTAEEAPYEIEAWFLDSVHRVVDRALDNDLMVMLNVHHFEELNSNPTSEIQRNRLFAIWKQLSLEFKNHSDSLLFEFLNEPNNTLTAEMWNALFKQVLDTVRVDNPTRVCVVGPPDWNAAGSVDKLEWPADTNMILTVHYYSPFQFTHQGASWVDGSEAWLGTTWDSTATQLQAVVNDFSKVNTFSETNNVPVHIGEFGAFSKADNVSRAKWTAYCARKFEEMGFSWAYWEFASGFGIYDAGSGMWKNYLLNALTEQTDPNSVLPDPWDVSNGDFKNELNGWSFSTNYNAQADIAVVNEEAVIEIIETGSQGWYIQLVNEGLEIIQGATYRFSFDAWTEGTSNHIVSYIGRSNNPVQASDYIGFDLTSERARYSFEFTLTNPSDNNARAVFDFSYQTGIVHIDSVKLEQLSVPTKVTSIVLSPSPAVIETNQGTLQLEATVLPEDADDRTVTWTLTDGSDLATLNETGLVTALGTGNGRAKVRAEANDGSGVSADITVYIKEQSSSNISELSKKPKVYSTGNLLKVEFSENSPHTLKVWTIDGRMLYEKTLSPEENKITITIPDAATNICVVELSSPKSKHYQKVLLKN